ILSINFAFDLSHDGFDLFRADGSLVTSFFQAAPHLGRVERLARFIFLDHLERCFFDMFHRDDAAFAVGAKALPADGEPAAMAARIHYRKITLAAKGTFHRGVWPACPTLPQSHILAHRPRTLQSANQSTAFKTVLAEALLAHYRLP